MAVAPKPEPAVPWAAVASFVVVVCSLWLASHLQHRGSAFVPGACQRAERFLSEHIVGQDLAIQQLVTAVCAHLERLEQPHQTAPLEPLRPLVLSAHGPPGVGKTFTHQLLARVLYSQRPDVPAMDCPGAGCKGYKVVYGLDFPAADRQAQLAATKQSILEHVASVRDPLLVFEEYDKMDCEARAWLRDLVAHAHDADAQRGGGHGLSRAIILLESNVGFTDLEQLLTDAAGDASQLTAEAAERVLKDALFASWRKGPPQHAAPHPPPPDAAAEPRHASSGAGQAEGAAQAGEGEEEAAAGEAWRLERTVPLGGCGRGGGGEGEAYVDTVRFMSLVTFFLPYLPLQAHHVRELMQQSLRRQAQSLAASKHVRLAWDDAVVEWLVSKVEFDGPYPLEGAKQVSTVVTRYVAPALRKCPAQPAPAHHPDRPAPSAALRLRVDGANRLLVEYPRAQ